MDLKSISFCGSTQIGTDLFTHMSVKPVVPSGVQAIELPEDEVLFPCVVVTFKGIEYVIPMSNVGAMVLDLEAAEAAEVAELTADDGVITAEEQELGVDVPSGYCSCVATGKREKHFNFEKLCKECTLPIWKDTTDGAQKEDQKDPAEVPADVEF